MLFMKTDLLVAGLIVIAFSALIARMSDRIARA
jgi:hypothetical protein